MRINKKNTLLTICEKIGTPVYAYDLSVIEMNIDKIKKTFPVNVDVFYSMKSNPNLGIVSFVGQIVEGIEVSSEGELYTALKAGVFSKNIMFSGPGKTHDEIEYAVNESIGYIIAESEREIEIIDNISANKGKKTKVLLRINPARQSSGARIKMGGMSKQFGIDEELLPELFKILYKFANVDIVGIQVYLGTQILDEEMIAENVNYILSIAENIINNSGLELKVIDLGGGFGVPYFNGDKNLDLNILYEKLKGVFDSKKNFCNLNDIKLVIESGRYIVAESGYFLTKVLYKKQSRGKKYLVVDGGSNFHSAAAGIGRFVRNNFPVQKLYGNEFEHKEIVDIVGQLCTPTDILAQDIELPICNEGDIIMFPKSGAYGLTASMTGFLSHPKPAEVIFDDNSFFVVGNRGCKEDFSRDQKSLTLKR